MDSFLQLELAVLKRFILIVGNLDCEEENCRVRKQLKHSGDTLHLNGKMSIGVWGFVAHTKQTSTIFRMYADIQKLKTCAKLHTEECQVVFYRGKNAPPLLSVPSCM